MENCSCSAQIIPLTQIEDGEPVVVNGVTLSEEAIAEQAVHYSEHSRERAAASLVVQHLLLEQVEREGISLHLSGEEQAIQLLLEQQISLPEADEIACRHYFEKNPQQFRSRDLYEVSHILLAADPQDFEERARVKSHAEQVIESLLVTPQQFGTLAKQYSACPSKEVGGSLGQISKGGTVPEFERQVFRLPQGLHQDPVETRYGYHVVRVDRKVLGQALDFEIVQERIAGLLYRQSQRQAVSQYIERLVAQAQITGVDLQALRHSVGQSAVLG